MCVEVRPKTPCLETGPWVVLPPEKPSHGNPAQHPREPALSSPRDVDLCLRNVSQVEGGAETITLSEERSGHGHSCPGLAG